MGKEIPLLLAVHLTWQRATGTAGGREKRGEETLSKPLTSRPRLQSTIRKDIRDDIMNENRA